VHLLAKLLHRELGSLEVVMLVWFKIRVKI